MAMAAGHDDDNNDCPSIGEPSPAMFDAVRVDPPPSQRIRDGDSLTKTVRLHWSTSNVADPSWGGAQCNDDYDYDYDDDDDN